MFVYHDLAGNGFSHGCIVVAECNKIYLEIQGGAGIFYYDFNPAALGEIVETLVSGHQDDLDSMAVSGTQRFKDLYPNMGWSRLFARAEGRLGIHSIRRDQVMIDTELLI